MKILFAGGGTLGPVTPLLAVARRMKKLRPTPYALEFAWAGTIEGPESAVVGREGIPFYGVPVAKFPRYPSMKWLTWPRDYMRAKKIVRQILDDVRPDLVIGAGGFTEVPVMREAARRKIPCALHQLDFTPGLSNRLVAKLCKSVTTSFSDSRLSTHDSRAATPCRFSGMTIPDKESGASYFFLDHNQPIVFVVGGGTGALALNRAMNVVKHRLPPEVQFIHQTGRGKEGMEPSRRAVVKEFMDERDMLFAYGAADIVVCRAGMGTLSELAALSKAAIVVPIPDSHQEANARALAEGIEIVRQRDGFEDMLESRIRELIKDHIRRDELGATLHKLLPTDDGSELAQIWIK